MRTVEQQEDENGNPILEAYTFESVSFEGCVDELLRLHDRMVCKQIDASACRTDYDYRVKRQAENKFESARETFLRQFGKGR